MDYLDVAKGLLDMNNGTQAAQAAALIAISEQLQAINGELDLLRQAVELLLPGEPIDNHPADVAERVTAEW